MALDLYNEFEALIAELVAHEVPYAVVGALALAIHGVPRATVDIDFMVPPEHLDLAKAAAAKAGYTAPAAPMRFSSGVTVHRVTKFVGNDFLTADFLLAEGPLDPIWNDRLEIETSGGTITTLTREGLIRMKSLSGRLKDMADIEALRSDEN